MTTHFRFSPFHIKLAEGTIGPESLPQKVQLMRTCSFRHPKYGKVDITRRLFEEMVTNFDKKVRGIEIMIDYSHESDREAAGWIKGLEIVDNTEKQESELWAVPDWTKSGGISLCEKEFAYLSADFDPSYVDPETGIKHGAVLLGAGLTNRPVIKKMASVIQLSELEPYKENDMNEEDVKKLEQLQKLMTDLGCNSVEEVMAKIAEMKSQNTTLNEEKETAEKKEKTQKLFSEGKLTKAQVDEAIKLPKDSFESFMRLAEMNQPIKSEEEGHAGTPKPKETESAQDKVIALAEEKASKEKIDIGSAISLVLSENAELRKSYHAETGGEEIVLEDE